MLVSTASSATVIFSFAAQHIYDYSVIVGGLVGTYNQAACIVYYPYELVAS